MKALGWLGTGAMVALLVAAGVSATGLAATNSANKTATLAPTTLTVTFEARPKLGYNRQGESTLSVVSASGTQTVKLLSGKVDPEDEHYWTQLDPVSFKLKAKPGSVLLQARLFVCDQTQGLCSVQEQEQRVQLRAGSNTVVLKAPNLAATR
ncbi:hypothetical protein [Deinococcus sp.]|uniref:hypothetical protein n=1 Tax=Deinococcus sp. TaxID=47478 RepID=UPI003B5AAF95